MNAITEKSSKTTQKPVATSKQFDATYVFGGEWKGKVLVGAYTIKCRFWLTEIKKYGVKNVIKFYAIKFGIGTEKYNCHIEGFGKDKNQVKKKQEVTSNGKSSI